MKKSLKRILLLGTTLGAGVLAGCTEGGESPLSPHAEARELPVASGNRGGAGPLDPAAQTVVLPQLRQPQAEPTGTSAAGTLPRFTGYLLASN